VELRFLEIARQDLGQENDIVFQPHTLAGLNEMLTAHAPKRRIMPQQIRQLRPLLDEMRTCKPSHPLLEVRNANQLAKHMAGVIETERLVKVAREQISVHFLQSCHDYFRFSFIQI